MRVSVAEIEFFSHIIKATFWWGEYNLRDFDAVIHLFSFSTSWFREVFWRVHLRSLFKSALRDMDITLNEYRVSEDDIYYLSLDADPPSFIREEISGRIVIDIFIEEKMKEKPFIYADMRHNPLVIF